MQFSPAPASSNPSRGERWLVLLFLGTALALRLVYAWHFRVDSDEPQHLHVVWAWTRGLLPYRDVFDNHMPVFQAMYAPLFRALGVRADILHPMRLGMIPFFAGAIWCVWKCARPLFGKRMALWTVVLAALCPPFFFTSVEFRPDQLWTLAWMLALAVLLSGGITPRRMFVTGLLLGFAFSVSMKSSLFLASLVFAFGGVVVFRRFIDAPRMDWRRAACYGGLALLGVLLVPCLAVLFFVARGAGGEMYRCVITHNVLSDSHGTWRLIHSTMHWLACLLPMAAGGYVIARLPRDSTVRQRIAFVFFAAAFYFTTLFCFWPILTAEDYLPLYPALMITLGPALLWLGTRLLSLPVAAAAFASLELAWIVAGHLALPYLPTAVATLIDDTTASPCIDATADKIGMVADVLKLTDENDLVMDSKGETIYRNRPHRYVLEGLTSRRLRQGLLPDDIAASLIATRTPIATIRRMPEGAKKFIKANYVPIAYRLRALGQVLREDGAPAAPTIVFKITIPSRYMIVSRSGNAAGLLDGVVLTDPRELSEGTHEFRPAEGEGRLVLIWAQAIERGYSPFTLLKSDVTTEQD